MLNVNAYEARIAARLLDFFDSKTPWQRGLWTPSVGLTLREVLEASEAVGAGVLTPATLQSLASYCLELVGRDFAFGDAEQKKVLQSALRGDAKSGLISFEGVEYRVIRQLNEAICGEYLQQWSVCLGPGKAAPGAERAARGIASHLLDSGFSSSYLHRWWMYKTQHEAGSRSISELLREAHSLIGIPPRSYELSVAFEHASVPKSPSPQSAWLSNQEVSAWLRSNKFDVSGVRQRGGLKLNITARDVFSAAEKAAEEVDRLSARVSLGTYQKLVPINRVWIVGEDAPIPLRSPRRRVEVHALSRENQVYSSQSLAQIDAAVELASPLNSELRSAAIAGGWAAIESLMTGPGDKERVLAADQMATITACSLPRAELTGLSYKLEEQGGDLAAKLHSCGSNRDRAAIVANLLTGGAAPTFPGPSDAAAAVRLGDLLARPSRVLRDIEGHLAAAFRRLYRQRNMVLHWGRTNAVGVKSCLRAVAPLVGAGLDRIAHAALTEKLAPLELAARAQINLRLVGTTSGPSPLDLLESP